MSAGPRAACGRKVERYDGLNLMGGAGGSTAWALSNALKTFYISAQTRYSFLGGSRRCPWEDLEISELEIRRGRDGLNWHVTLGHYSVEVEDTAVKDLEMICTGVGMPETTQTAAPGTWDARSDFTFHDGHTGLRCIG